ncbi:GerMN domain-containing protein [Radiobacillus kanasensis]|uniref:GerMN domain-containing protein n=1 Tax=Radiobacillus kanasensis TaxID=2844358 RepID=UPI001E60A9A8|nr:GerMN domain-containing protein [Radiobacillus kanasensis]UFT97965.1 GerMN domain-containing protein [Radiobacillus kanasensis]
MKKLTVYTSVFTFSLILLSGCGLFKGEQSLEEMDKPPEEATYTNDLKDAASETSEEGKIKESADAEKGAEATTDTVERQLYLLDSNGMVVPQTVSIPKAESKAVASQVLEYLVKNGPVTELLPNGFQAVLPAGTQILGLDMKENGTLVVDVSDEFKNYEAESEEEILQAMTYTLTQFENVKKVQLWINGYEQEVMPVNGTPISKGVSRANGINIREGHSVDLMNSEAVTLYYPTQHDGNFYHVPITQHVEVEKDNVYQSIVETLVNGPTLGSNLLNVFNDGTSLTAEPTYKDGVLTLNFNENVLNSVEQASISDKVMETLVLTLTDQPGVEAVDVKVENVEQVFNESGEAYSEPVTRNTFVPTGKL